MIKIIDTLSPYETVDREDIQYTYCHDYNHISRYKGLRQIIHEGNTAERYVALETPNAFETSVDMTYYTVPANLENRLDIIARDFLGSADYSWVIAYFNNIQDGFTAKEGQILAIPKTISSLFNNGEILSPISANRMNLGSE